MRNFEHPDTQYKQILNRIINDGVWQDNRTDKSAKFIPSATIEWDLRDGFPALTTKHLYFKQSIGEIVGFLQGATSAARFRDLGCNFWSSDANENKTWLASPFRKGEDDVGNIYGALWRNREVVVIAKNGIEHDHYLDSGYEYVSTLTGRHDSKFGLSILRKNVDQIRDCVDKILNHPQDRRNIFHAWFPEMFPSAALPPCHVMYEFVSDVNNKVLHMTMTQRSTDFLLGAPMNLFGSALILKIIAELTGYTAGQFTHNMTNVHLYSNQMDAANIQIANIPLELCDVTIHNAPDGNPSVDGVMDYLDNMTPDDVRVNNYKHHPALPKVEMAQER